MECPLFLLHRGTVRLSTVEASMLFRHSLELCLQVSTFHSVAYTIVRDNHTALGFTQQPVVWGRTADRKAVVREAMR